MADNLIFPVKFDLEAAVRKAQGEADKYLRQLENTLRQKPIRLDVAIDGAAPGSIDAISKRMAALSTEFNKLTEAQRVYNRTSGEFTPEAQKIIKEYAELTAATQTYAQSLSQITAAAKRQTQEQMKAQEQEIKRYEEYWKRKEAENAKQAQQEVANAERARKAQQQRISQEQAADAKRYQEWLRQKNQEAVETERVERQKQQSRERTIAQQNREFAAQRQSEQQRQQAISASLRAEYQRIEAKKQAEAASRRELQMLNQQYAAEERRQRLAASQASIAKRQQVIKTLRAEENTIVNITAKLQHWQQVMNSSAMDGRQFKRAAEEVQRLSQKLSEAQARISQLTATTSNASARQTAAVKQVSNEFKHQDGYVSRLLKRLAVYASFSYAIQFLTSIREVTAHELQRVSLGAIIQDQQKANQIFAEIKSFALTSPLKILDLTKYAKQVAAYGFAADRVFDVTKRLADISVGLGVDMGRLSLAVSQIKAATVLKASELRQLTETGLPMLDLLSKKLTETQGKLVSAADVMDLISKRAISYEMVEEILYDLTDAGGMFYNMQVKQSQTLFGMWSKLGDAAAIMYDQIGNTSSVNAGMKLAIRSIESMMRNWKTTARVLDSVAVAMTVYIVGLKNAAVASKALTSAVALENLAHQQQIIRTPKVVAGIIGINNAKKISTLLTNLHTKAVLSEAAATNVLTKGFWKLTAAMLANPWVAVASAVALTVTALIHFIGNTETAAERAEKLNNSVASLKSLTTEVEPLIDTYKELADKTERTADEQKKLNEVAAELARKFPAAITVIKEYGQEMGLAADEVARLYENMKRMKTEDVRQKLTENENAVNKLIQRRQQLQKYFDEGKMWAGGGGTGGGGGAMVAMSDKEKRRITTLITDIDKQILDLNESIINAKRELGELPSEATQTIEGFGAWKKKLTEFNKEAGGVKVKLFDDSTINQFGLLEEALDAAAKKYKEATESVEKYNKTLERGVAGLGQEQFDKIAAERDEAQAMKELSEEALNYYNAMALLLKVMGGGRSGQSDPRLSILREMASTLKQVNKEYDELAKKEGATKALADTQDKYANTFKYLQSLATKYKFELPDFGVPTDAASLTKYLDAVKEAMKKLPKSEKAVLSLETDIADINMADAQKNIEAELKRLSDRISRTKTAKEFYEKILSQTGNRNMAARLATSIFGENGKELNKEIAERMRKMVEGTSTTLPDFVFNADMSVNAKALRQWAQENEKALGEGGEAYKELIKIADDAEKDTAKMVEGWLKATEKAKTYGDKLADVYRRTATEISRIEAEMAKGNIDRGEGTALISDFRRKEAEEVAKLQYEAFKDSPLYVQMFDDLDHASTRMLENMKARLLSMQGAWRNLDPTQLKELQSRLREIDTQLAKRNPFKALADGLRQYRTLRTQGDARGNKTQADADADVLRMTEAYLQAEEKLAKIKSDPQATEMQLAAAAQMVTFTKRQKEEAEQAAANWQKVEDAIGLSANELMQMLNWAGNIAGAIADISGALGADEEDVQYWNDVADALNDISGGIQDIVSAAMSGNVVGIISSTLTAIPKMFVGFTNLFSANKVKKANKEIKRQQKILDQLEYTYGRLEKAADKLFGHEYLNNYQQQLKTLQAQQKAYLKQAEAERSKGKKKDKDKIKEYENQARETANRIKELQDDLVAHFTGSSRTDVARQMAKSWIDARASMSDTFAAIKGDYQDLIKNMLVETMAAKIIENAFSQVWKDVDERLKNNDVEGAVNAFMNGMDTALTNANDGMEVWWKAMEARGFDMKKIFSNMDSEHTGIAKSVAGATSEEINNVAAIGNTLMYYVSPIPRIDENLARVVAIMGGRGASAIPQTASEGWTDWQQQAMDNYNAIARNTADTVVECRRAAEACEKMTRLIKTKGATSGLNVFLNS